ncbi:MAG: hypothetical protein QXW98_04260 [Candidatus Caldarchaeum sp.]
MKKYETDIEYQYNFCNLAEVIRQVLNRNLLVDVSIEEEDDQLFLRVRNTKFIIDTVHDLVDALEEMKKWSWETAKLVEDGLREYISDLVNRYGFSPRALVALLGWSDEQLEEVLTKNVIKWKEFTRLKDIDLLSLLSGNRNIELRYNGSSVDILCRGELLGTVYNIESLRAFLNVEKKQTPFFLLRCLASFSVKSFIAEREYADPVTFRLLVRSLVEQLDLLGIPTSVIRRLTNIQPAALLDYIYTGDFRSIDRDQLTKLFKLYLIVVNLKQKYKDLIAYLKPQDEGEEYVVFESENKVVASVNCLEDLISVR